jgi:hypothetical protein
MLLLLAVVIGQWIILWLLIHRLEQLYLNVWDQLGRPSVSPTFRVTTVRESWQRMIAQHRLMLFIFRRQNAALHDDQIVLLVWCARFGYGLMVVLLVLSIAEGPITFHF